MKPTPEAGRSSHLFLVPPSGDVRPVHDRMEEADAAWIAVQVDKATATSERMQLALLLQLGNWPRE